MKKILTIFLLSLSLGVMAQSSQGINYQAVVRDSGDNLIKETSIGIQVSILENTTTGNVIYQELHTVLTNQNGLLSINIGEGTPNQGVFTEIVWGDKKTFLKTEIDLNGGDTYTITGISEMTSVPYALYARSSGSSTPGPKGDTGAQGDTGLAGADGAQGIQGEKGDTGLAGADGAQGVQGEKGDRGLAGADGAQGIQGEKGDTGADGADFKTEYPLAEDGDFITYDGTNWVPKKITKTTNVGANQAFSVRNPFLGINHVIALFGIFPSRSATDPFIGEIMMVGFNFAPRNWAKCDGQLFAISQNSALFSLLGTTFGGDGRTTFGLPDLRGRSAMHIGHGLGLDNVDWGQRGGRESQTLNVTQLPTHSHTIVYE